VRILLVEDDELLGDGIAAGLRQVGYVVDWVGDGAAAESAWRGFDYAVVVLDINLPKSSGLAVLKRRRAEGADTPVLLLTARDSIDDRVSGLDAGADDYLVKPFALAELQARIRALSRRASGRANSEVVHGALVLDPVGRVVTVEGGPVALSAREFALLQRLLESAGRVVSRESLEQALYGWDEEVESNALEVHIHHLRRKLGKDLIRTLRGIGYMIPKPAQ
jgi:DNA-binding response OmpR family regulator